MILHILHVLHFFCICSILFSGLKSWVLQFIAESVDMVCVVGRTLYFPHATDTRQAAPRPPRAGSCSRSSPFAVIGGGRAAVTMLAAVQSPRPCHSLSLAFGLQPLSERRSGCHQQPFAHKHYTERFKHSNSSFKLHMHVHTASL